MTKSYHCGTLTYTKIGLFSLFSWILWGDFCLCLMEVMVPAILPIKLKDLGCPNWMMGFILSTIPSVMSMAVGPYVSFKSDRYRSRWGRRIPFVLFTLPFLCISLCLLGFSEEIRAFLQNHVAFLNVYSPATMTIALIAVFMVIFQFFNMFVQSVFWYLFNDVVPALLIGRFVGLLRIASTLAGVIFNYFIFEYAGSYFKEIFVGAAILYFIGFGLMCLRVKEGQYPPIVEEEKKQTGKLSGVKIFFWECFGNKFYWLIFATTAFNAISNTITGFTVFFNLEMGLNLAQIGKLAAINGVAAIAGAYFASIFVDRWHPMRITAYLGIFGIISVCMNWVWIFVTLPGNYFFWLCIASTLITAFQLTLAAGSLFPREMRLFPQSRFGQFCSAQALLRCFCTMGAGVLAGVFIDIIKYFYGNNDFAYRFIFIWTAVFSLICAILTLLLYRQWYKMGGDKHFHPPAIWSPTGIEEMPVTRTIGPQTRWLNMSMRMFDGIMTFSVLLIPFLMYYMYYEHAGFALKYFGILLLPLSGAAWIYWNYVKKSIKKDMEKARRGETLRRGIPHHGMLMVVGISFLPALGLWVAQVVITVNMKMEQAAIVFGIANVVTNFMLIGITQLMTCVERDYSTAIDEACN